MEKENPNPLVYTPAECQKLLMCGKHTIYEAIRQNRIPNIHLGRKILIPRHTLMKWLEGGGTIKGDDNVSNNKGVNV